MEKINLEIKYEHKWIDHPLAISTPIDDRDIEYDCTGQKHITIKKKINLSGSEHKLVLKISGKNEENTKVDKDKNIVDDTIITIKSIKINDIELMPLLYHTEGFQTFYINGQKDQTLTKLTEIGHNGLWEFRFKTPIYDWMLESLF